MMDMVSILRKQDMDVVRSIIIMDPIEDPRPGEETVVDRVPEERHEEGVPEAVNLNAGVEVLDGEEWTQIEK
jgi:hypothetical protein